MRVWLAITVLLAGRAMSLVGAAAEPTGPVQWRHLSSRNGELPMPLRGREQTACVVVDIDKDGLNDFVLAERTATPSLVWYHRTKTGWETKVIDDRPLHIEAGGAVCDVDGDGDPDLIFGGDWLQNKAWWWENPGKDGWDKPWTRREIKSDGATQHHDQIVGDFDGDGQMELVFWNQGNGKLFLAKIPPDPKKTSPWPLREIFSMKGRPEGLTKADIDGDGKLDIVGGGRWFRNEGGLKFTAYVIDEKQTMGRAAAGQLIDGAKPQVVMVLGEAKSRLKWYEQKGEATKTESWVSHELLNVDVDHGHSLEIADINGDGKLDIFCAEMRLDGGNPKAHAWVFYGDGKGNFQTTEVSEGIGYHESRVADLDGDGRLDILDKPYNWDTPRIDMWLNRAAR